MSQAQTHSSRTRLWVPLGVVAAAAAVGIIIAVVTLNNRSDKNSPAAANPFQLNAVVEAQLKSASTTCGTGTLADENNTLLIDMAGDDFGSGDATIDDVVCVLTELAAPRSILARMESTRALDGMQTAGWSGYEATWTYHPDDGLDLILTKTG